MNWLIYKNTPESTQLFIGLLLIAALLFITGANIYFWILKIKNSKSSKQLEIPKAPKLE